MRSNNTSKKRILIFSTAYYPFVGGAEVSVKEITDRLGEEYDFDLITAKMRKGLPNFEKVGVVNVYRVGFGFSTFDKLLLPFLGALKVRWLNKQLKNSEKYLCFWAIMVTFGSGSAYIFNIFNSLFGGKKIPIVLTLQEGDSEEHLKYRWAGLISFSWKMALRSVHFLTALSSFLLERAEKYGYKGKSAVIPNGVDIENFSQVFPENENKEMEKFLGKKEGEIFLVTASRLVKKNATDDIISALSYLPENISLVVMGRGIEGYKLQAQAEKLKVSDRVKFIGYIPHRNMPRYFTVCDIFVRPSRSEGFGNSFIEAMASRLPVIATPVGGITDFLSDKETGIFCSPNNPKSIAEAVNFILENPELRKNMIEKAYSMTVSRFSWDNVAKRMKNEVFDKI